MTSSRIPNEGLLLVSYQFPPLGGVGVQRALSLAKFFPGCGYDVHVLTPSNGVSHTYDPGLVQDIPPQVTLHRTFTPEIPFHIRRRIWQLVGGGSRQRTEPGARPAARGGGGRIARMVRKVIFPDPQVVWTWGAARRAVQILKQHSISTVVVTVPPFSSLRLVKTIKDYDPSLTVVADFRDEWLEYYLRDISPIGDKELRERAYREQRSAIQAADLVVAVTDSSLRKLKAQHPEQPAEKFAVIPNGYDHTKVPVVKSHSRNGGPIRVIYMGTVYRPCTPRTYLDALDSLPESLRSRFETKFVGRVEENERPYLANRKSKLECAGFLPQSEAMRSLTEADYLLLPLDEPTVLPGKVYEYMAAGKPILALTQPHGELGRLMKETRAGYLIDHADVRGIAGLLESLATNSLHGLHPDAGSIERYSRKNLAAEYAELIRRVAEHGIVDGNARVDPRRSYARAGD